MKREIIQTADGSSTFYVPELKEHYHSTFGAIQESQHVFIKEGLLFQEKKNISIFELGFGTGLNALLTFQNRNNKTNIIYNTIEAYPISNAEITQINYLERINADNNIANAFSEMHDCEWGKQISLDSHFRFCKYLGKIHEFEMTDFYDVIYFDAFAPEVQPKLWEPAIIKKMYNALNIGGVMVTYCAKGQVRRDMKNAGFTVERIPGPPGKREMLRAIKH